MRKVTVWRMRDGYAQTVLIFRITYEHTYTYAVLMEQLFVAKHTIRQTEIPALLDSLVTNTPSVKTQCPQTHFSPCISVKT